MKSDKAKQETSLVRFLVQHCVAGVIAGLVFCGAVLYLDIAHMKTLLLGSDHMGKGLYLLVGSICGTFGALAMAVGVMRLGDYRDHPDREF